MMQTEEKGPVRAAIQAVITDIEGTTSSISYVKELLFPYARQRIATFLAASEADGEVQAALAMVRRTLVAENKDPVSDLIPELLRWIDEDRKETGLKMLQGLIWREGYAKGELKSHLYPEVATHLQAWKAAGKVLAVYSSGSEEAQVQFFRHTESGDLTGLFSHFFDTRIGQKKTPEPYQHITETLALPAEAILFLSDVAEELDAAQTVGLQTIQLVRAGTVATDRHATAADFGVVCEGLLE